MSVGEEGCIDRGEGDRVVDGKSHTAAPTPRPIYVDEVISGNVDGARLVGEFSFLQRDDGDAMKEEKVPQFVDFAEDAVAVPLHERRKRRERRWSRVRMNSSDEKEDEDEQARKWRRNEKSRPAR